MSSAEAVAVQEVTSKVTYRFNDGVEFEAVSGEGESLLDVARNNEVPIVHQCLTGSCASCICRVDTGEVSMDSDRVMSLLPSEAREGFRLTCTAYADTDCVVDLDYPSTFSEDHAASQSVITIEELEWVNHNTVRITAELDEDAEMENFEAGQYVQLKVPGTEEWRSYSMSSTVRDLPELTFYIRVLDDGVMSNYLRDRAAVGDTLEIDGPYGVFYLREEKVPQIMIAGGTGLAPMMSMIDTLRLSNFRRKPVILAFGCSFEKDLFAQDELELRGNWMRNLDVRTCVSRPEGDWDGLTMRAQYSITEDDITEDTIAYLCGPPAMNEAAREHLEELGVKGENIHVELFDTAHA